MLDFLPRKRASGIKILRQNWVARHCSSTFSTSSSLSFAHLDLFLFCQDLLFPSLCRAKRTSQLQSESIDCLLIHKCTSSSSTTTCRFELLNQSRLVLDAKKELSLSPFSYVNLFMHLPAAHLKQKKLRLHHFCTHSVEKKGLA